MAFDFDAAVGAPFRMQPGLRRLAPGARQLTPLQPGSARHAEKLGVLARAPDDALACADGFDPRPALSALGAEAARHCPEVLRVDTDGWHADTLGWQVGWDGRAVARRAGASAELGACLAALPAHQRVAALLSLAFEEDFAIVDGDAARLPWMAVCLPSGWDPRAKCGRSFAEVHAPVADNALIVTAARHLSALVCRPERWERFVWTVTPDGAYDHHPGRRAHAPWAATPEAVAAQACWRTERQTFIPVPDAGQAVFTIHVAVQPLRDAIGTPRQAAALHAALDSMSDAVLAYRGLTAARAPLLAWLHERANA